MVVLVVGDVNADGYEGVKKSSSTQYLYTTKQAEKSFTD